MVSMSTVTETSSKMKTKKRELDRTILRMVRTLTTAVCGKQ